MTGKMAFFSFSGKLETKIISKGEREIAKKLFSKSTKDTGFYEVLFY